MEIRIKNIFFMISTFLLTLLLMEAILQILTLASPAVNNFFSRKNVHIIYAIDDVRLGKRPDPNHPEHDLKGFRNKKIPAKAHIVALGDSQTYGTNVQPEDTWPSQLEGKSGLTIYNMGFGGYGPTHSLILWDEAVELKPGIIIEAFYFGNDLFDSFNHVYNLNQFPEFKTSDPSLLKSINEFESNRPLLDIALEAYNFGATISESNKISPTDFLGDNLKLLFFFKQAKSILINKIKNSPDNWLSWQMSKLFALFNKEYCESFSSSSGSTILTSKYRLIALEQDDPRIEEGLQISLKAIKTMANYAKRDGIVFTVLLIPTKELVFKNLVEEKKEDIGQHYRRLIKNEVIAREKIIKFLKKENITYIDSLTRLRDFLSSGEQPYRAIPDGHPNKSGHKAISDLTHSFLNINSSKF